MKQNLWKRPLVFFVLPRGSYRPVGVTWPLALPLYHMPFSSSSRCSEQRFYPQLRSFVLESLLTGMCFRSWCDWFFLLLQVSAVNCSEGLFVLPTQSKGATLFRSSTSPIQTLPVTLTSAWPCSCAFQWFPVSVQSAHP